MPLLRLLPDDRLRVPEEDERERLRLTDEPELRLPLELRERTAGREEDRTDRERTEELLPRPRFIVLCESLDFNALRIRSHKLPEEERCIFRSRAFLSLLRSTCPELSMRMRRRSIVPRLFIKPTGDTCSRLSSIESLLPLERERVPEDRLLPDERERPTDPLLFPLLRVRVGVTRPLLPERDRVRSTVPRERVEFVLRVRTPVLLLCVRVSLSTREAPRVRLRRSVSTREAPLPERNPCRRAGS